MLSARLCILIVHSILDCLVLEWTFPEFRNLNWLLLVPMRQGGWAKVEWHASDVHSLCVPQNDSLTVHSH
jgi:hypothetical protein